MKTYYLCDLNTKKVLSAGELPATFGNINGLVGLEPEHLADLAPFGSPGFGFFSYSDAVTAGMDNQSLEDSHKGILIQAWRKIEAERDSRQLGGFYADGYWWHSGDAERTQYSTLALLAVEKGLPPEFEFRKEWKTMSGELTPMTVARVRLIRDAGIETVNKIFDVGQMHRSNMEASDDPFSYDFSTGWPKRYGD